MDKNSSNKADNCKPKSENLPKNLNYIFVSSKPKKSAHSEKEFLIIVIWEYTLLPGVSISQFQKRGGGKGGGQTNTHITEGGILELID